MPAKLDTPPTAAADLERGRALYAERAWARACDAFVRADAASPLEPDDLELLAFSAALAGRDDEHLLYLDRLYQQCLDRGQALQAARAAFWLGFRLAAAGEVATAGGWLSRAQRIADAQQTECGLAGFLLLPEVRRKMAARDFVAAAALAERALQIGERCNDADLTAFARNLLGRALVYQGRIDAGLPLLDEAMLAASKGELSPPLTGLVYCIAIAASNTVYALDRSREWTAALGRWCDAQPELVPFTSTCRAHRAEVLRIGGSWP